MPSNTPAAEAALAGEFASGPRRTAKANWPRATLRTVKGIHLGCVDDEAALLTLLRYNLEKGGFEVGEAVDGEEALLMVDERRPDLMALDWMLPTLSGIEVCRRIRRKPDARPLPIVMLTARGEESDRVRGLDGGADDYVVKPFSPAELLARIRAILRRMRPALGDETLRYDDLSMDLAAHRVTRGDAPIHLGPTEFRLLRHLMEHPAVCSRASSFSIRSGARTSSSRAGPSTCTCAGCGRR